VPKRTVELPRPRGLTRKTTSWPLFRADSMRWNSSSLLTGLLVNFEDKVSAVNAYVFSKRPRLHFLDDYAFAGGNVHAFGQFGGDGLYCHAKFAFGGWASSPLSSSSPRRAAKSLERSAIVTEVSEGLPLRMKPSLVLLPGLRLAISATSSSPVATLFAVDGNDGVADFEASLLGRASGDNVGDGDAFAVDARDCLRRLGGELDADGSAGNFVLGTDELVVDLGDGVGRHGEADAGIRAGLGVDGGIDADDFAVHVDQRTAGITRVDGGIGLDEVLELASRGRCYGPWRK